LGSGVILLLGYAYVGLTVLVRLGMGNGWRSTETS
jgi:hypothetical protein